MVNAMHRIITGVWNNGKWPEDWTQSTLGLIVSLFKNGILR